MPMPTLLRLLALLCSLFTLSAHAAPFQQRGGPFYLLADSGFSSTDNASVRLEANAYDAQSYGGVDIVVYSVPKPVEFLEKQKDLHRVDIKSTYRGDGAANALVFLWDEWYARSRQAWQRVFSPDSRAQVTQAAPALKSTWPPRSPIYKAVRQYPLLTGYPLVSEFRYPVEVAKPIDPRDEARLPGSSSEFSPPQAGNVHIPLGHLAPGLYIVEGHLGSYRAVTLLFVADSVLITKVSGQQMLAWAANKKTGQPVADAALEWSDGNGVLKSGKTDAHGLLSMDKTAPEQNYVFGTDSKGGVFVAENFYYPAEVFNTKLYMVTDRPLYRPGDTVQLSVKARHFDGARSAGPIKPGAAQLVLRDPAGTDLMAQTLTLTADGAVASVKLPDNAVAGGYNLRINFADGVYTAPIRVAEYSKPHYDVELLLDRDNYKAGEAVSGSVRLRNADGTPVGGANVELVLRSQPASMVNGEPQYQGAFPVKTSQDTIALDAKGQGRFSLPAAQQPSRYVIKVIASQHGDYPVSASREILVGGSKPRYLLQPDQLYTLENQALGIKLVSTWPGDKTAVAPKTWRALRLEDRSVSSGPVSGDHLNITLAKAGSYQISVLDAAGQALGQLSHNVSGPTLKAGVGAISILFDHEQYHVGDTARAVLTFPEDVNDALLSIELENVQQVSTLQDPAAWFKAQKINGHQWQLSIPVTADYRPNVTFSALYIKNGVHTFANRGFAVAQPAVDLAITGDKAVYKPGDMVTLTINSKVEGKPAAALLSLGVIDEMVYLLQPEITPDIGDFFYHPHRDAVRTSASLNFYGYDLAFSPRARADDGQYHDRSTKMLVRPRRDNIDTAYWNGQLRTDANGRVQIRFRMPDALSRWRITARAITTAGVVGQHVSYIQSDLPAYLEWRGPRRFREGDMPALTLAVHNQTDQAAYTLVVHNGDAPAQEQALKLARGTSFVPLDIGPLHNSKLLLELKQGDQLIDRLQTGLWLQPVTDLRRQSRLLTLKNGSANLALPADASQVSLRLLDSESAAVSKVLDQLIDYPYGCVEQTASRLLPLTLAYAQLKDQPALQASLRDRIAQARLRLLRMSGPKANFTWWGDGTADDPLLSAYARLAEQRAAEALGVPSRFIDADNVLQLYAAQADKLPLSAQALTLWLAQQAGEPVRTPVQGLLTKLNGSPAPTAASGVSTLLSTPDSDLSTATAFVLAGKMAALEKLAVAPELASKISSSLRLLETSADPLQQALASYAGSKKLDNTALLSQVSADAPTFERALALLWLDVHPAAKAASKLKPDGNWQAQTTASASRIWQWQGDTAAINLKLPGAPDALRAELSYATAQDQTSSLPIKVTRRLYELQPGAAESTYTAKLVAWGAKLSAQRLYVDEVELEASAGKPLRYGLIEMPLPPGAMAEEQHWGLSIANLAGQATYTGEDGTEKATLPVQPLQERPLGYAQPVPFVDGKVTLRQIVRFTQGGHFMLPAARLFSMYTPQDVAYENGGKRHEIDVH